MNSPQLHPVEVSLILLSWWGFIELVCRLCNLVKRRLTDV